MESVKNAVSNLLGHNKDDTTTAETSQHHHSGHQEQRDDQIGGTTAATTTGAGTAGTSSNPSVHDQTTSQSDLPSKTTSAVDTGAPGHHDHHDRFPEGGQDATRTHNHHQGPHTHDTEGGKDARGTHGHHEHHSHHSHETEGGKRVQSPDQGPDPALVGEADVSKVKLTGTGEPGSHSALFGLTPDGKKNTETSSGSGAPVAAHSKETAVGGGRQSTAGDTGSRAPAGGDELKEQMHKSERDDGQTGGRRTDPAPLSGEDGAKPGAGAVGGSQGTGDI